MKSSRIAERVSSLGASMLYLSLCQRLLASLLRGMMPPKRWRAIGVNVHQARLAARRRPIDRPSIRSRRLKRHQAVRRS